LVLAERSNLSPAFSLESFVLSPGGMPVIWLQARTGYLLIALVIIIAAYLSRRFSWSGARQRHRAAI
jgi:hypothetical protein